MEQSRQDLLLGLMFFTALLGLVLATLFLKGVSFEKTETRTIHFPNAGGLSKGDNVFVLGHIAGQVTRVDYDSRAASTESRIVVTVLFDSPVMITTDYQVRIEEGSLLGGQQVAIEPGDAAETVPPERPLQGVVRPSALESLSKLLGDDQVESDVKSILAGIRDAIEGVNAGDGTIGRLFQDDMLYADLTGAVQSLRRSLEQIETGQGLVGRIIYGEQLADDAAGLLASLRSAAVKVDTGEGLAGRLINDTELAERAAGIVDDVAAVTGEVRAGEGTLGALLRDEAMATDVRTMLEGFAELSERVNDPESGLIGELVAGRQTRDEFTALLADLRGVAADLHRGNGLLARLLSDDEMAEQFSRVLNQVARAIEDARESAPIGTFFQVLSGGF